jgi:hypothetical protein
MPDLKPLPRIDDQGVIECMSIPGPNCCSAATTP